MVRTRLIVALTVTGLLLAGWLVVRGGDAWLGAARLAGARPATGEPHGARCPKPRGGDVRHDAVPKDAAATRPRPAIDLDAPAKTEVALFAMG